MLIKIIGWLRARFWSPAIRNPHQFRDKTPPWERRD